MGLLYEVMQLLMVLALVMKRMPLYGNLALLVDTRSRPCMLSLMIRE
jgi:hypothetical protein